MVVPGLSFSKHQGVPVRLDPKPLMLDERLVMLLIPTSCVIPC